MKIKSLKHRPYDNKEIFYRAYECDYNGDIQFSFSQIDNKIRICIDHVYYDPEDIDLNKTLKEFDKEITKRLRRIEERC